MLNWETIVALAIVAVAVFWGVRAAWRSVRKGQICSDCSDSGSCPLAGPPQLLDLKDKSPKQAPTRRP